MLLTMVAAAAAGAVAMPNAMVAASAAVVAVVRFMGVLLVVWLVVMRCRSGVGW